MKTLLKPISFLPVLILAWTVLALPSFAQTSLDECTAIYERFLANRKGPEIDKLQAAVATGKDYLGKCGSLADNEKVKDYVAKQTPRIEAALQDKLDFQQLNSGLESKDYAKAFAAGKSILERKPDGIDVMLALASAGYDASFDAKLAGKFNDDTMRMAKSALETLDTPAGANATYYKSPKCSDAQTNAKGWMNAIIGNIMWYQKKDQKGATPYLYRSTQTGCSTREAPETYRLIGSTYLEEFNRLENDRQSKIKAAGDKDTGETQQLLALQLGYLERMMDAYGRAYNLANADPKFAADKKDGLLKRTKEFYGLRHDNDMTGFDDWLKGLSAKPLPDPSSTVTPVAMAIPPKGT